MKVLGHTKVGYDTAYIIEVTHGEIKAAFEKAYSDDFKELRVGDTLNLGDIPGQRARIVEATRKMQAAYEDFVKVAPIMADVARVIGKEGMKA